MSTGNPNTLMLTPLSGTIRPRIYGATYRAGTAIGHSRSRPVERDSTFLPRTVKPSAPTEKPTQFASTALPLEPAREPVPGAIPASGFQSGPGVRPVAQS
jgi:hypothetical protein